MKQLKNNKGYSLIELIIVIAIMVILAALATFTIGMISTAKCRNAALVFNQQIATLWMQTKAVAPVDDNLCMVLEYRQDPTDGKYYNFITICTVDATGTPVPKKDENNNLMESKLYNRAEFKYKGSNPHPYANAKDPEKYIMIQFNKSDGSVLFGNGLYEVTERTTEGRKILTIELAKDTGNHYIK